MYYTKDNLINMPVGQLIDVVLSLQEQTAKLQADLRMRVAFDRKMDVLFNEWQEIAGKTDNSPAMELIAPAPRKRGRKAYTPEEREEAYQKQLEKQMAKYYARKESKAAAQAEEETLPLTTE